MKSLFSKHSAMVSWVPWWTMGTGRLCILCLPSDRRSLTNPYCRIVDFSVSSRCKVGNASLDYYTRIVSQICSQ